MFTITIKNVHDKQLGELVARIGTKKWSVGLTHHDDMESTRSDGLPSPKKKRQYMGDGAILSLTGRSATAGSMREKCLETMEKLEVTHGIGSVTRGMLKKQLAEDKLDTQVLYQLVREGYLKKL